MLLRALKSFLPPDPDMQTCEQKELQEPERCVWVLVKLSHLAGGETEARPGSKARSRAGMG